MPVVAHDMTFRSADMMSRFRNGHGETTLEDLKGFVDVLIGTHRVLSKDVVFAESRPSHHRRGTAFGVAYKEKSNSSRKMDVRHLTATLIPRTLHMSLIGYVT